MLFECDRCLQIAVWCFCAQTVGCPAHYKLRTRSLGEGWRKKICATNICCRSGGTEPARPVQTSITSFWCCHKALWDENMYVDGYTFGLIFSHRTQGHHSCPVYSKWDFPHWTPFEGLSDVFVWKVRKLWSFWFSCWNLRRKSHCHKT